MRKSFKNISQYTRAEDLKRLEYIINNIRSLEKPAAKVLDVGCGNGNVSFQLGYEGFQVTGVDISEEVVESAKARNFLSNVEFVASSILDMDEEERFDAVVCGEVLEHMESPDLVLEKLTRLLQPNGILIVTIPNGYGPRELLVTQPMQWMVRRAEQTQGKSKWSLVFNKIKSALNYSGKTVQSDASDLVHLHFFTKRGLHRLMDYAGYEVQDFGSTNFIELVFPFSLIYRKSPKLQEWDCNLADKLPHFMVSGYMGVWKMKKMIRNRNKLAVAA